MPIKAMQRTLEVATKTAILGEVRKQVDAILRDAAVDDRQRKLIVVAIDEALSPIVKYSEDKGYNQRVTLTLDVDDVRFKAAIDDPLNVFDINNCSDDELAKRVAIERTYRIGFFLIRQVVDEVSYTYRKGFENRLELIKFL